jgi:alpha-ribazole phosphatase/probable phosphoglycerate mutase|tara:strand:- start:166 stop:696 length:531 start_codon:yes stop_codon:yes gene_type:complete
MIVDLLRHGEPIGGRLFRGLQDDHLTDNGWSQMESSTTGKSWNFIASSPLMRCSAFAKHVATKNKTPYRIYDGLVEFDWGDWQGKSADNIGIDNVNEFKRDPISNGPRNSENLYKFNNRVLSTFSQIIEQCSQHHSILIVSHAGVIRSIKSHILNLPAEKMFNIKVGSGSCERFKV